MDPYIQHALLQKTKSLRYNAIIILGASLIQLDYQILSRTWVHRRHCLLSHKINITIITEQFKIQRLHKEIDEVQFRMQLDLTVAKCLCFELFVYSLEDIEGTRTLQDLLLKS